MNVVRVLEGVGHGGSLWVAPVDDELRGVKFGHAFRAEKPLVERFPVDEGRFAWLATLADLAAVDGAVVLDSKLRVLGFGAFVELPQHRDIVRILPDGERRERAAVASLFAPGGTHAFKGEFQGINDFEVVAFLVVLPQPGASVGGA